MKTFKIALFILIACVFQACTTCEEPMPEPCGNSMEKPMVDLIILMDQSTSMGNAALAVSNTASQALQNANDSCDTDLRVVFLGLDGQTWASTTLFTQSHRDYLVALHGAGVFLAADQNHVGYKPEQGANGVEDLSNLFDWREKACRAIFYISDEELDSFSPRGDYANEDQVTMNAINAAVGQDVTVFTHFIDHMDLGSSIIKNYQDLADETGGEHFYSTNSSVQPAFYESIMPAIVCNSCNACELNDLFE